MIFYIGHINKIIGKSNDERFHENFYFQLTDK